MLAWLSQTHLNVGVKIILAISIGKMIKNKGLFLCVLIACIFSVTLMASIPAFENALKKRLLQQELLELQYETGLPPLVHRINVSDLRIAAYSDGSIEAVDAWIHNEIVSCFGLPVIASQITLTHHDFAIFLHVSPDNESVALPIQGGIMYTSNLFEHVELVAGRFPTEPGTPGIVEVVVSEKAAINMPFMLGSEYLQSFNPKHHAPNETERFKIVGIIRIADPSDPFWVTPLSDQNPYTNYASFIRTFHRGGASRFEALWTTTFDHRFIEPKSLSTILNLNLTENFGTLSNLNILQDAFDRELELGVFLWVLLMPTLALLMFFIIMISGLILDHDKIEISLFYSRGASKARVLAMYAIQATLITGVAIVAGILLSMLLCSVMGASSGFLEFVGRAPLEVTATAKVFWYAVLGAALFITSMLLPILFSKSASIVTQQRLKAVRTSKPFFEKYYLDLILLAISLYGYFSYQNLSSILSATDAKFTEYAIDPLIFLISTFFLIGCAMLFTRLYPFIIRLLFSVGRSIWPPAIYASLSAARSRPRSRYIMIFIILTISNSLVASAAARTINQNCLDRVMYDIGADLVIKERWSFTDPNPQFDNHGSYIKPDDKELFFFEPPFEKYSEPGQVALATKVYRNDRTRVMLPSGISVEDVNVMAIYPDEFARVSWQRGDMYAYHLNHLMNAMSANPSVVLLSRSLMDQLSLLSGDEVWVWWANNRDVMPCYIYDAVDYFPAFNPLVPDGSLSHLVIMNYELVNSEYRLEPYEVWIMKEEGASSAEIVQYIWDYKEFLPAQGKQNYGLGAIRTDLSLPQFSVNDAQAKLESVRNDPFILSMNGFLTLNFVMILAVTAACFLMFWSFDLRSRRLQISIMRSTGMPQAGVIAMLLWEQILLSLLPLVAGFILGKNGASLFVPMFEMGGSGSPLPFRVFIRTADSLLVGVIVSGVIVLTIVMLWYMASRIKISQTLKLGEE